MITTTKASTFKEVAEEALFQLDCGHEFAGWMFALMTAIRDDQRHSGGANSAGLSNLGVYLAEAHLADAEQALEVLNGNVAAIGGAK